MRFLTYLFFVFALCIKAQDKTNAVSNGDWPRFPAKQQLQSLTFTTPAYREEALKLVIEEANRVAQELRLSEQLPITESNLVAMHISPPRMAKIGVGNVTTSNYVYYVSVGDKFSSLSRIGSNGVMDKLKAKYSWPMSRMDTNAAYQLATQWLTAVSVDVKALNHDCDLVIRARTPEGINGKTFIPFYRVYWVEKGSHGVGSVAGVDLIEPTKSLQQLYVKKSEYILRNPLVVTNINFLLSQTNIPARDGEAR